MADSPKNEYGAPTIPHTSVPQPGDPSTKLTANPEPKYAKPYDPRENINVITREK